MLREQEKAEEQDTARRGVTCFMVGRDILEKKPKQGWSRKGIAQENKQKGNTGALCGPWKTFQKIGDQKLEGSCNTDRKENTNAAGTPRARHRGLSPPWGDRARMGGEKTSQEIRAEAARGSQCLYEKVSTIGKDRVLVKTTHYGKRVTLGWEKNDERGHCQET